MRKKVNEEKEKKKEGEGERKIKRNRIEEEGERKEMDERMKVDGDWKDEKINEIDSSEELEIRNEERKGIEVECKKKVIGDGMFMRRKNEGNMSIEELRKEIDIRRKGWKSERIILREFKKRKEIRILLWDEGSGEWELEEKGMVNKGGKEGKVVEDELKIERVKRMENGVDGDDEVREKCEKIWDNRVVINRNIEEIEKEGIIKDKSEVRVEELERREIESKNEDGGKEVEIRVLRIKKDLDGKEVKIKIGMREKKILEGWEEDNLLKEIDEGDELSKRMIKMKKSINLKEIEVKVEIEDELKSERGIIEERIGKRERMIENGIEGWLVEEGWRRLLNEIMVEEMDGELKIEKIEEIKVMVEKKMNLDMERMGEEFLDEDEVIEEGRIWIIEGKMEELEGIIVVKRDENEIEEEKGGRIDNKRIEDDEWDNERIVGIIDK